MKGSGNKMSELQKRVYKRTAEAGRKITESGGRETYKSKAAMKKNERGESSGKERREKAGY